MKDHCYNCGGQSLEQLYAAPAFDSPLSTAPQIMGVGLCTSCNLVRTTGAQRDAQLPLLKWSLLATLITPFAILENILGPFAGSGATVQIAARWRSLP